MFRIAHKQFSKSTLRRTAAGLACVLLLSFLPIPEAEAACPNGAFPALGNTVELVSCTEAKAGSNVTSISLGVPAGVNAGDLLVAVVAKDDDEVVNTPAGWVATALRVIGNNDGYLAVFARVSPGGEPANYTFTWTSGEQAYAYMMRFTGASGQGPTPVTNWANTGTAVAPSITTTVANSLILRIVGWDDDDEADDPASIVAGHTNITQDASNTGFGTVSGGAAYVNQAAPGASGTANFANGNEQWAAATLAIEPIEFRLSMPDASASVCGSQQVTLRVTNRLGTSLTWFTGSVTLSASGGLGDWTSGGALNGVLNNGGANDGVASYQFAAADAGVATFQFTRTTAGVTNFDVDYGAFSSIENPTFDPNLTITNCTAEVLAQSCVAGKSTTLAIGAQNPVPSARGRMVLIATGLEGTTPVTAASFNSQPMTLIYQETNANGLGNVTSLWGILDANLPAGTGAFTGNITTADPDPSMCLLYLDNAEQVFPQPDGVTPNNGAVNGSQAQNQQNAVTTITTTADDALVLSLVGNGSGGADYTVVTPSPPMSKLFDAPDPGGGAEFEGSSGVLTSAGAITVTETWGGGNPNRHSHVLASFPPLPVVPTEIRIAHDGQSDVCSVESITISVTNSLGSKAQNFTGTITITTSAADGTWTVNDAVNTLVNNGSGSVSYTFDAADNGDIVLDYQLFSTDAAVDFDVTSSTPGLTSPSGANDPLLDVVGCTAEVNVNDTSNVCSISETVTLFVRDRFGGVPTGTIGTVVLNTDTGNGDYLSTTGAGNLDNGAPGDGLATYQFDAGDGGTVTFEFHSDTPEALNFSASSTYISFDAPSSDEDLEVLSCQFRITHSGSSDVCSQESVLISVYNSGGAPVTDYVGTVNLSTSTGVGTWTNDSGNGTLTDPFAGDGNATYEFVAGDNGTVDLFFAHSATGPVNLNISDGTTTDSNPIFDNNLAIANCSFQITLDDGTMTGCSFEPVTITIFDSGGGIATDYTGTVSLNTDTLNGTWADAGGLNGTLDDASPDDGFATYTFAAADSGTATFNFFDDNAETVNFNLTAGVISEDGGFDPNLEVSGCTVSIVNSACHTGEGGTGKGNLTVNGADPGRMVVMIIWHIDATPQSVTSATFDGAGMTPIYQVSGGNTAIEMWGIFDSDLPATGGSYAGDYFWDAAPTNTPSMCLVELADADQSFPQPDLGSPNLGQVNGSAIVPTPAPADMVVTTSISTAKNNALVLTAALHDLDRNGGNSWFNSVDPDPPIAQFFFGSNAQNPEAGTAGGSQGVKAAAGLFTVTDTDITGGGGDFNSNATHIVASFNPRVAGPPIVSGYVPVLLFDTLSGNLAYKAIGVSMRTASNGSGGACSMVPVGTGTSATLAMPAGSTVLRSYLYWSGSGEDFEADDTVTFGPTGSEISITADDMFLIENVGGGGNLDYFAGYKDVTSQVVANGSFTLRDLTVQTDAPWSTGQACGGGWGMVVVFSNPDERFRVANIFHGFQPFQNSAFTLVPRNFRMATTDNPADIPGAGFLPNGAITHITLEGDETLSGNEYLGIQTAPGDATFNILFNSFNPLDGFGSASDFNSTVTRPLFYLDGGTGFYEFDSTAGLNSDGYEIDQPGPDAALPRSGVEIGASWGFDIDTHFIDGADSSGVLWNFAQPGVEAEQITTEYSSGQDLVMLISEVITVTNFDLADLEVFKSQSGDFKVNGVGQYQFQVVNNGNGGITGGEATGRILVADIFPSGLSLDNVSGTAWNCGLTAADAFTCEFDIANDCDASNGCATVAGQLQPGESLPVITANVLVADTAAFPNLSINVKNVVRMQHNAGCGVALTAGVIPDPDDCTRSPQFDNVNDLDGGAIDIMDLVDKSGENNNVDSVITEIRGTETNLGIDKVLNGILEVGETASYTLTVTNYGPDATTGGAGGSITVTDPMPSGVTFDAASGVGWSCSLGPLNCTYAGVLASGASTDITIDVTVTGSEGQNVTNTAVVTSGSFNFDSVPGNDSSTLISTIVAPPVASNERFLFSVSVPGNNTAIGGLAAFENHDYFIYNPLTDAGSLFYDNSGLGYGVDDADAVHLFKNGHVAISANGSSSIGSGLLNFEPEDIVVWDPIQQTATLLFDGSAIFDDAGENIDAVYVKDDGRIVFSTTGPASISFAGPTTVNFNQGDIVEYNPDDGSATILIDASDANIFNGEVQVDGLYIRVDDSDPDQTREVYVLSVAEAFTTIGACASCDPVAGTGFSRDDVVELDLTGVAPVTETVFLGNAPLGVFTPTDNNRTIDAIHTLEDAYLGHFAVSQSQAGSTCEAGQITIRKHKGLTHAVDTDYAGTVRITTDIGQGDWSIAVGNGSLDNATADDGAAIYTFVPADNGEVTLFLTEEAVSTLNVNVSNGITAELASEDPNFTYNSVITNVTYRDEWTDAAFDNNDGSTSWASDWVEVDGEGVGPLAGNISAPAGELSMTSTMANPNPSISRIADLSLYSVTETVLLNFDYHYESLNSGSDVLVVEARANSADAFTTVQTFSGIGGTNTVPQSLSLNLSTLVGGPWSDSTEIRFRISGGYTGTSRMHFDNIELATGTTDCGIGFFDHYQINIDGVTGNAATLVTGIQCVGSIVTVAGHDGNDFPSASEELVTLRTSTGEGDWTLLTGVGAFNNGSLGDGIATYNFAPGETAAVFLFNYTDPDSDPELVNFNLDSAYAVNPSEDPSLSVQQAGLLFYNETNDGPTSFSPIPTQIAGKPSNALPDLRLITIEGVRTSDDDPLACTPLFDAGNTLTVGFAGECLDPATCSPSLVDPLSINGINMQPATDNGTVGTTASYTDIDILMVDQGGGRVGGQLVFNYADAGEIELHAQYEIPLGDDLAGTTSGDIMRGSSLPFVVRPFGFDIDFSDDRSTNGLGGSSNAVDADGSVFATAGLPFNTTVSAVAWQAVDDLDSDGVPDAGAALYDNSVTPNYGNESSAANYDVLISLDGVVAPLGGVGTLSDGLFNNFSDGVRTKSMTFDEVGIIDLTAQLVDSADGSTPIAFMSSGVNLVGNVKNVGRFIPNDFLLSGGAILSRPLAAAEAKSILPSNFTYLGEEFGISAMVLARGGGATPAVTRNYVGAFAKLDNLDFTVDKFFAVDETGAPDDYSSRLSNALTGANITWNTDPAVDGGEAVLSGNLVLERQAGGAPDGPYDMTIAVNTSDSDAVPFVLDLDVDGGGDDAATIGTEDFRYGRLVVENSFGSELEPLALGFSVEFWNGSEFVINEDDSATTLFYDASTAAAGDRSLIFVPGSYDVLEGLESGETVIESAAVGAATDVITSIFQGRTFLRSGVDSDSDNIQDDSPFFSSPPGLDNEGSALIEFDLSDPSLPFSLDFLSYDWRGVGDLNDENEDGDYSDNPRGLIEFGSFRGHDLIINWREIYNGL